MKIGPSEGNSGAIIRWGKHLDNGLWLRKIGKRHTNWRFRRGYVRLPFATFMFGN
jgi:hypothetical protein